MSDSINWAYVNSLRATAAASVPPQPDPFPDLPAGPDGQAPALTAEAALRIDTGGAAFPGGVFVDGVRVK